MSSHVFAVTDQCPLGGLSCLCNNGACTYVFSETSYCSRVRVSLAVNKDPLWRDACMNTLIMPNDQPYATGDQYLVAHPYRYSSASMVCTDITSCEDCLGANIASCSFCM